MPVQKKILITDDHAIVRMGISNLITGFMPRASITECDTAKNTFTCLSENTYDLLILDITLPDDTAQNMVADIRKNHAYLPIIIFSMYPEEVMAEHMLRLGATKYLNKEISQSKLIKAIEECLSGIRKPVTDKIKYANNNFTSLSPTELTVLLRLINGETNAQVAEYLKVHPSTIATYKTRIYQKMNVSNFADLMKLVLKFGMVTNLKAEM